MPGGKISAEFYLACVCGYVSMCMCEYVCVLEGEVEDLLGFGRTWSIGTRRFSR